MITLLPMAGASQRFRLAGYALPKYTLPLADHRPMLRHVLDSLAPTSLITVAMREEVRFVGEIMAAHYDGQALEWRFAWLDKRPAGPLESALCARKWLHGKDELLVSYCDCWLRGGLTPFLESARQSGADAAIIGFENAGDRFGRVHGQLRYCAGGIAWFRYAHEFVRHGKRFAFSDKVGVPDVVYSFRGFHVYDGTRDYVDLGTPQEYQEHIA